MAATVDVVFDQHVALSAEEAYALLCDWRDHARWVPLTRVTVHDERSFTAYSGLGRLSLPDRMQVIDKDDDARSVTIEKKGPVLTGLAGFSVRRYADDECIVTWREHIRVPLVPGFLARPLESMTRGLFRRALKNLTS